MLLYRYLFQICFNYNIVKIVIGINFNCLYNYWKFWGLFCVNNFYMFYKLVFFILGKFFRFMFYGIKKKRYVFCKNNVIFKIVEERKFEVYFKKIFIIVGIIQQRKGLIQKIVLILVFFIINLCFVLDVNWFYGVVCIYMFKFEQRWYKNQIYMYVVQIVYIRLDLCWKRNRKEFK